MISRVNLTLLSLTPGKSEITSFAFRRRDVPDAHGLQTECVVAAFDPSSVRWRRRVAASACFYTVTTGSCV